MTEAITVRNFNAEFVEQLNANFVAIDAAIDLLGESPVRVASLADVKALTGDELTGIVTTQYRTTAGDGGGGTFVWRSGDQSAGVTADPENGIWVPPDSDVTGATGAWQRQYSGPLNVLWWGAVGDDSTDCTDAFESAFSFMGTLGSGDFGATTLYIPAGKYLVGAITSDVQGAKLTADTGFSTRISAVAESQAHLFYFTAASATFHIENIEFMGYPTSAADPTKFPTFGVVIESGANGLIENCRFLRCRTGLHLRHGNTMIVRGCKFEQFDTYALKVGSVNDEANTLTAASYSAGYITFEGTNSTGLIYGSPFEVSGCTPSGYNGSWTVAEVVDATTVKVVAASDPGAVSVLGQIDATGGGISECIFVDNDAYSGSSAWSADYAGTQIGFLSGCAHTTVVNWRGGSTTYGFVNQDDLGLGDDEAPSFVEFYFCAPGRVDVAGYYIADNGSSWELNGCKVTAVGTTGVGLLVDSATAAPQLYGCDVRNAKSAGIKVLAAYSLTVHNSDFHALGSVSANGIGIDLETGSTIVEVNGCFFSQELKSAIAYDMDYAVVLRSGFAGTVRVAGSTATGMVIGDYVNNSTSGATLTVRNADLVVAATSTPAVQIRQTSTGDALLVEDSASPDATPFRVNNAGRLISGTLSDPYTFPGSIIPHWQLAGNTVQTATYGTSLYSSTAANSPGYWLARSRSNTIGTQTAVQSGNVLGTLGFAGSDGTAFIEAATIRVEVDGTPGTNDMPGKLIFATTADGAAAVTARWSIDSTGLLAAASGGSFGIPSLTWANIPAATTAGQMAFVSNAGTKGSVWVADGTRWKPMNGTCTLATLDTASSNIANSETIVFQYLIPANLLQTYDRLRLWVTMNKSGTTDTGTFRLRVGTAGTTSDTAIVDYSLMTAAHRSVSPMFDFRLESATSLLHLGNNASANITRSWGTAGTTGNGAAVAITSAAANALYVSVGILSSSTNDTVALQSAQLQLISTAN